MKPFFVILLAVASTSAQPTPDIPSFKGQSAAELSEFFHGKPLRNSFSGPEDAFPNQVPGGFWDLAPARAATALADANRTPTHRKNWKLELENESDKTPPPSGWLLYRWSSSGCYSFSSQLFALRFGVPDPHLIVFGYNSIGAVGQNPWADQPAENVRVIPLSDKEARFLADAVFWLASMRAVSGTGRDSAGAGWGSTADGSGTTTLFPEGRLPVELGRGDVWAVSGISMRWSDGNTEDARINLTHYLLSEILPQQLGARWEVVPEIGPHSLATSTEERLKPRVSDSAREGLSDSFAAILRLHAADPVPAEALARLVLAAGNEALSVLLPQLLELQDTLPAKDAEDQEFETLEKRFQTDHFGDPFDKGSEDDSDARERFSALEAKRRFQTAAILRDPLAATIIRLRLAGTAEGLKSAVTANGPDSRWALNQLFRLDPDAWATLLIGKFSNGAVEARRTILKTLASGRPPAAKTLIDGFTPSQRADLAIEIAHFHRQHDAVAFTNDLPLLMALVRDRKADLYRRGEAIELLGAADLGEVTRKEFTQLLVAEILDPQVGEYGSTTLSEGVTALASMPDAAIHLDLILSTPGIVQDAYQAGFSALAKGSIGRPDRKKLLADYVRPRFSKSKGMMNDIFLDILAYDLRPLTAEVAGFASAGPSLPDGDGVDYSGGRFTTPVGQRYHLAREITALWSERDAETVGRMWIHFIANHPRECEPNSEIAKLAESKIRSIPKRSRQQEIAAAIALRPFPTDSAATEEWLKGMAKD
ncbi:MAG: hypothetical protein V4640_09120 [Verrucomicrobiota bacterium]